MSSIVINDTLSLPAEQVLFIGNYSILYTHENKLYVKCYGLIYNYAMVLFIGNEMYMKLRYNKAEIYMRVSKHRENRIQEFITEWEKPTCSTSLF